MFRVISVLKCPKEKDDGDDVPQLTFIWIQGGLTTIQLVQLPEDTYAYNRVRSFISAFGKVLQAHLKTVEVSGQEDKIEEFLHTCSTAQVGPGWTKGSFCA